MTTRLKNLLSELKTTQQKILYTLYYGRHENGRFNLAPYNREGGWISGGWLPMYAMRGPLLGGDSADRRLRELREAGWPIIDKEHKFVVGGVKRNMHIYALGVDPGTLDWDWTKILDEWPNYLPPFDLINDELEVDESEVTPEPQFDPAEAITDDIAEMFHADELPTIDHVRGVLDRHLPQMEVR